jgi:glucose/arabinose dehydrogenase
MKRLHALKPYALVALLAVAAYAAYANRAAIFYAVESIRPDGESAVTQGVLRQDLQENDFKVMASGLEIPWDIAFLPDGSFLVTERPGRIKRVAQDGAVAEISGLDDVRHSGEGGLLGIAVHPDFSRSGWVYVYRTVTANGAAKNRIDRYKLDGNALTERTTILQNIPGALYHDGGELVFGGDGKLYATTGDAGQPALAQDVKSLAGKILRLNDDGTIPGDNPFGNAVWSYGHRNPQGLAWDAQGRMWSTEHGRSGVQSGYDELNIIEPGKNYGWPNIQGDEEEVGMRKPVVHSGPDDTWAPAGMARFDDSLLFGGLRGEALYQARIGAGPVEVLSHFEREYGRIRAVVLGPDRMLYFTTSNRDGRGLPREGDDKVVRVNPRLFQ